MKKGLTELVFILDKSGSMGGLENDTCIRRLYSAFAPVSLCTYDGVIVQWRRLNSAVSPADSAVGSLEF